MMQYDNKLIPNEENGHSDEYEKEGTDGNDTYHPDGKLAIVCLTESIERIDD